MSAGSLDTNVLVRLVIGDVPAQRQAARELIMNAEQSIHVADLALSEAIFVFQRYYEMTRPQVADAVRGLMDIETIQCSRSIFGAALAEYVAHPALSFEDCYLAAAAQHHKATPLYTFDKTLANQVEGVALVA